MFEDHGSRRQRFCPICGESYFGLLSHENCPGKKIEKREKEKSHKDSKKDKETAMPPT